MGNRTASVLARAPTAVTAGLMMLLVSLSGCQLAGGELELRIGTLMPTTGQLDAYGPDGERAVQLAVKHINEADAGIKVTIAGHEDDKSVDTAGAPAAFDRLLNAGATVVIGSYASSVTESILDRAKEAGVVVITPASTSPRLTLERDNGGFFFRIPPSDALQGKVLAGLVYDEGERNVNIIAVNNAYGNGLGQVFQETFEARGGSVGEFVKYGEQAQTFSTEVQTVGQGNPDAVVLIGYVDDGAAIMKEAFAQGLVPDTPFYFSEGVKSPEFVTKAGQDDQGRPIVAGFNGTAPGSIDDAPGSTSFAQAFQAEYNHEPSLFAVEAYDATVYAALAALHAGATDGTSIKNSFRAVANSPGESVSGPAAALEAVEAGTEIDYGGAAHDFDFDPRGDPADGVYVYWSVTEAGEIVTTRDNVRPE